MKPPNLRAVVGAVLEIGLLCGFQTPVRAQGTSDLDRPKIAIDQILRAPKNIGEQPANALGGGWVFEVAKDIAVSSKTDVIYFRDGEIVQDASQNGISAEHTLCKLTLIRNHGAVIPKGLKLQIEEARSVSTSGTALPNQLNLYRYEWKFAQPSIASGLQCLSLAAPTQFKVKDMLYQVGEYLSLRATQDSTAVASPAVSESPVKGGAETSAATTKSKASQKPIR